MLAGPAIAETADYFNPLKLTILHTNDALVNWNLSDGRRPVRDLAACREGQLINKIRSEEEHVLLLDAGDVFRELTLF
jgi:5'-nucleotidase